MALNRFSVGRDTQLVVIGPSGRVDLQHVTGFEARQLTKSVRVDRLDGHNMGAELPKGWEGTFDIERGNSAADDFIISVEQVYFNGGQPVLGTMYQVHHGTGRIDLDLPVFERCLPSRQRRSVER